MRKVFPLVIILLAIAIHTAHGATIYVPDNFKTIQEAISKGQPGDIIIVRPGTFKENIIITKPIVLKSEKGAPSTIIEVSDPDKPVIAIKNTEKVRIIGFTLKKSSFAGLYIEKTNNSEIEKNICRDNGAGIYLYASSNNVLTDNQAIYNERIGIYLQSSHNNTLMKNMADSNKEKGIFLISSNNNKLMYNSASLNRWNGITLWSSTNNRLEGNEVLRNTYSIVESGSSNNVMVNNYTWRNYYIILPIILIYLGVVMYFIQKKIFTLIYGE